MITIFPFLTKRLFCLAIEECLITYLINAVAYLFQNLILSGLNSLFFQPTGKKIHNSIINSQTFKTTT